MPFLASLHLENVAKGSVLSLTDLPNGGVVEKPRESVSQPRHPEPGKKYFYAS
jgi:hypothetical protein